MSMVVLKKPPKEIREKVEEFIKRVWEKMTDDEKFSIKFGLYPYWILEEAKKEGFGDYIEYISHKLLSMSQES